jgi:2-iminobutanoate/2-iminopropanoate deaminase
MPRRQSINIQGVSHPSPIPMASKIGNIVYSSGIGPREEATGTIPSDPAAQAKVMFNNVRRVMEAAGGSPDDIIHMLLRVKDRSIRQHINPEWEAMFPDENSRPARHAVEAPELTRESVMQCEIVAVLE